MSTNDLHEHVSGEARGNGANHPPVHNIDVTRRAVVGGLGAGGLAALLAVGGRSGVAAQGATPPATPQGQQPVEPHLEWLGTLSAQLGEPIPVGTTAHGARFIVPVIEGTLEGPNLTATVVPPGGDWLLVRPDGVGELDVRVTLQTQDGALLYATYRGYITRVMELLPRWLQGEEIPREEYYLAVTPYFETGAAQYDWLQRTISVGIGSLIRGGVSFEIFAVS